MTENLQPILDALQAATGHRIVCGSIVLNINESKIQTVETTIYQRVEKRIDAGRDSR